MLLNFFVANRLWHIKFFTQLKSHCEFFSIFYKKRWKGKKNSLKHAVWKRSKKKLGMASVSGVHIERFFCPFLCFDKLIWIYKLGNPFRALRWKMQLSTQIESKGASFVQKWHFISLKMTNPPYDRPKQLSLLNYYQKRQMPCWINYI